MCLINSQSGKQGSKIFGFYVESALVGHGDSSYHGHCFGKWRGKPLSVYVSWRLNNSRY